MSNAGSNDHRSPKGAVAIPAVAAAMLFTRVRKLKPVDEPDRRKPQPMRKPPGAKAARL